MGKLTEWLKKNATVNEGANLAEFEELEVKETLGAVETKEQALDAIKRYPKFESAFDSMVSKKVEDYEKETFNKKRLPEIEKELRAKIEQELNPEKTPEQKRIEELEKRIAADDLEKKRNQVADKLVEKAKELNYPNPEQARRYVAYGDQAEEQLKADIEYMTNTVNSTVEAEIKKRYGNQTPPKSSTTTPDKLMKRTDFDQLNPQGKSDFIKDGGVVED